MKSNIKIGDVFTRWTVLSLKTKLRWAALCRCECGKEKEILKASLNYGDSKSCGCLQKNTAKVMKLTHGQASKKTNVYNAWANMKARCNNPNHPEYQHYGARGIKVCKEWSDKFEVFCIDIGDRPHNGTLERKDTNLGYFKDNCHWVSHKLNVQNMRTSKYWHVNGVRYNSLSEAAEAAGKSDSTILAWCEGYRRRGIFYPPKTNCHSEAKYD